MKQKLLIFIFLLSISAIYAQQQRIKIGAGFLDTSKVKVTKYQKRNSFTGVSYKAMEFEQVPTKAQQEKLKENGIVLLSYIQDNIYYVAINNSSYSPRGTGINVKATYDVDPLWKISQEVYNQEAPNHAQDGLGSVLLDVKYFDTATATEVEKAVSNVGGRIIQHQKVFHLITIKLHYPSLKKLASNQFIESIDFVSPDEELYNVQGRSLSRANILNGSTLGRGLHGEGMIVGIWDSSIENHPDLGNRLISKEFEYNGNHGQHVSGTVAGAGILDPRAKGMAPKTKVLGWNFRNESNGLSSQQEMLNSARDYGMRITQNSYGLPVRGDACTKLYPYTISSTLLDLLVNYYPKLSHIFSAGNDQSSCLAITGSRYYTSAKRAKNPIFVGALDENGKISNFSSWGPMDDGRIVPHVTAFGVDTYSTVYNNSYDLNSGTSMACPVVSGVMTLVYQRYKQIHGTEPIASLAKAAMMNTADDKGNIGPDYVYGYGAVDGEKTVELLENNQYFVSQVSQGEVKNHSIDVPKGVKQLRVMVVWSDKEGKLNNKVLINDLDLTLSKGGTTYFPWVLDPANPSKEAIRDQDHLNNQEQITIDNPQEGTYDVAIKGFEIPEGAQQYSLVYHFVTQELEVVYPNGGEKLNPGDELVVMWNTNGYDGKQTIELSTDNGVSYKVLEDNIPSTENAYTVTIPQEVSSNALVRVVQNSTSDKSDAVFSIMNTPQNLKIDSQDECGTSSMLTWDKVEMAKKYFILKADVNEGSYTKVAETTETMYTISELPDGRNIYSVSAVSEDGVESERAFAVIAESSNPIGISEASLPFEENFKVYPSTKFKVVKAKGVDQKYTVSPFSRSGAHTLVFNGNEKTTLWNDNIDLFSANPDDVAKLKLCELNATNHEGKLWMRMIASIGASSFNTAKMRVQVDGETISNSLGQKELERVIPGKNVMYYDLSDYVGKNVSLSVESVLQSPKDSVLIGHIRLFKPKFDASINFEAPKRSKTLSNAETIEVVVTNLSGDVITNLPVSYQINDQAPVEEIISGPINPFQKVVYQFNKKADLSKEDVKYEITTEINLEGDQNIENNKVTDVTTRFGDYHVIPLSGASSGKIIATQTPKGFTDDGGKVLNYSNKFKGSVAISPQTTGKYVKIKFTELNLKDKYDVITVRNGKYSFSEKIAEFRGGSNLDLPVEFISSGYDKNLFVQFISGSKNTDSGWYAEVSEVDSPSKDSSNIFAINFLNNRSGNYTLGQKVGIRIENRSAVIQKDVKVRYRVDDGEWILETIPSIEAGGKLFHEFAQEIVITETGKSFNLDVEIVNKDSYLKDNSISTTIFNDYYCFGFYSKNYSKGESFITKVAKDDVQNTTSTRNAESNAPQYFRENPFPFYKGISSNQVIKVTLGGPVDGGNLSLWIDWNNNGNYADDDSVVTLTTSSGQTEYEIPVVIPENVNLGKYFTRLRCISKSSVDPCLSGTGEVEDYTIELFDKYPISKDLAIIGSEMVDGNNLSTTENVSVTIKNNSGYTASGFQISYQINEEAIVTETVSTPIDPLSSIEYTFDKKADLSAPNLYKIKFKVFIDQDEDQENNVFVKELLNQVPTDNGFFALDFDGKDDLLNLGTLNNKNLASSTYELWMNPKTYGGYGYIGFGRLFQGKNATIFLHGENNTNYPDHSLVVSTAGGTFHTKENSIDLKRWQHIAVTIDATTKTVKVYVDGELIEVVNKNPIIEFTDNSTKNLYVGNSPILNRGFGGMIDQVRIWSEVRSDSDIKSNYQKASLPSSESLVAEFGFDEGYYNKSTKSGDFVAIIENADYTKSEEGIWKELAVSFNSFTVEKQAVDFVEVSKDHIKSELFKGSDITKVTSNFTTAFKNASVKVSDVDQKSGVTLNDFTNPVVYDLQVNHLGKTLKSTLKVELAIEQSPDADLLSFEIPSIDVKSNTVTQNMVFVLKSSQNLTSLVPVFTLSEGAKAYVNETEIISGQTKLDFSKPLVIKVFALNGRDYKLYLVSFEDTINWTEQQLNKTYGDANFDLLANSTSTKSIVYKSSNPGIIAIENNKAVIKSAGKVAITANLGEGNLSAPVFKEFIVDKAKLTVKADDKKVNYLDPIPELTFSYEGFVYNDDDTSILEVPKAITSAKQGSEEGLYEITFTEGKSNKYEFEFVKGTLTIVKPTTFEANFIVLDEYENPIQNAKIVIGEIILYTDENGKTSQSLSEGDYNYSILIKDKEVGSGSFIIKDGPINIQKIISNLGVETPNKRLSNVNAYPNPFVSVISIKNAQNVGKLSLYSTTGRLLRTIVNKGSQFVAIDGSSLSDGVYFLRITTTLGKEQTIKLIKK